VPEKPAVEKPAVKKDDLDDLFNDAPKNPPKPAEKPAEKPAVEPAAEPVPEKPAEPAAEKPAAEAPAEEKPAAEEPAAEAPPAEAKPAEKAPAEKKPAPKVEEDDPFKISAEGQLAARSWTDDTGTFQIQGRLVALLDGKVRILKETGKTTTVSLERLSAADRTYVDEVAARHGNGIIGPVAAR
jgi:hypothetical protein